MFQRGIQMVATVCKNRLSKRLIPFDGDVKTKGRGTYVERSATTKSEELSVVSCYDNKIVTMLSNFVGSQPTTEVKRFSKKEKQHIGVSSPKVVTVYDQHMLGVDLLDSLLGYYRNKIRCKKWQHHLFFHLLDMTIVNTSLLWRRTNGNSMSLLKFSGKQSRPSLDSGKHV